MEFPLVSIVKVYVVYEEDYSDGIYFRRVKGAFLDFAEAVEMTGDDEDMSIDEMDMVIEDQEIDMLKSLYLIINYDETKNTSISNVDSVHATYNEAFHASERYLAAEIRRYPVTTSFVTSYPEHSDLIDWRISENQLVSV